MTCLTSSAWNDPIKMMNKITKCALLFIKEKNFSPNFQQHMSFQFPCRGSKVLKFKFSEKATEIACILLMPQPLLASKKYG